ncbi:MAG TPA: hypothetical protein VF131_00670 [Blastocatellia bacterium]|nr:hypothetical protein [Blastocatellia bacterium]
MKPSKSDFTPKELSVIDSHRTPYQVQRYLSSLPYNREEGGGTLLSFRGVIRNNRAHCLEAAIVAAVILEYWGYPPLLVSIESQDLLDHVLFLYRKGDRYGSVARSRDIGLHGRKPVFRTVRDLVMSYFDTYIDKTGRITGYSVADLNDLGNYDWRFSLRNVWKVERHLQEIPHAAIRSSDARYRKWHRRYLEFSKRNPGQSPDYYPTRPLWVL